MNAYSKDLRLKVLEAVERGVPRREVSDLLSISMSTISRYVKLKASGEEIALKPSPGRTSKILADPALRRALWRQLQENDTATLEEHSEMFEGERGVSVSVAPMSRAVRKLGVPGPGVRVIRLIGLPPSFPPRSARRRWPRPPWDLCAHPRAAAA